MPPFPVLRLPAAQLRIEISKDKPRVFDIIRQKWVVLTPEEWVRQHFVNFLIVHKGYPRYSIANEVSLSLNSLDRRADTIIYDKQLKPLVVVEYKAPDILIDKNVLSQVLRYNLSLGAPFIMLSNGMEHFCMKIQESNINFINVIPNFEEIKII